MDELKDSLEKFKKEIKIKIDEYSKNRSLIWKEIEKDKCRYCDNGVINVERDGEVYSWECEEYFETNSCKRRRGFIISLFGSRFVDIDISNFEDTIRNTIESYEFDRNFIITGGIGTGKTSLLACLTIKAKKEKRIIAIRNPIELVKHIFNNEYQNLDSLKKVSVLGIDDLGIEGQSTVFLPYFTDIIDGRWKYKLPTILTTNLSLAQLEKFYPRVFDRLIQEAVFVELKGESWRRK